MKKKVWIPSVIVIALIIIGFTVYPLISNALSTSNTQSNYQTEPAKFGSLTINVDGVGTLRSNQTATLYWKTSGIVETIQVDSNETINKGQILASLSLSSLPQANIQSIAELVSAQEALDKLLNSNSAMAQAQLNLANANQEYNKALWYGLSSSSPRVTNEDTINAARAAVTMAEDEVEKAEERYNDFIETPDSDPLKAAALSTLSNARLNLDQTKLQLNFYTNKPDNYELSINEGEIAVAKAALEDAQREWDKLKEGPNAEDIKAAQARVTAIQATLDQINITAPFNGTITTISMMVGDDVTAGTMAFRIDDFSSFLVKVPVSEVDINTIKVGQSVEITFDAIQTKEYKGEVVEVSSVGISDSGTVNFDVTIKVIDPDEQVKIGMTAVVHISTTELENILLVPSRAVRSENGIRYVYVLENGVIEKKEITLGASANNYSQIIGGDIEEGSLIVLNPPVSEVQMGPGSGGRTLFGDQE